MPSLRRNLVIAGVTVLFGFLVNAFSHLVLLLRGHELVQVHRGTLQFASAWIGDGLLLPLINISGVNLLIRTGGRPTRQELLVGTVAGGIVTGAMHVGQATRGLVNWSMPEPWRWNALGWYHLLFMWCQLGIIAVYGERARRQRSVLTHRDFRHLGLIVGLLVTFAAVLRLDYQGSESATLP